MLDLLTCIKSIMIFRALADILLGMLFIKPVVSDDHMRFINDLLNAYTEMSVENGIGQMCKSINSFAK